MMLDRTWCAVATCPFEGCPRHVKLLNELKRSDEEINPFTSMSDFSETCQIYQDYIKANVVEVVRCKDCKYYDSRRLIYTMHSLEESENGSGANIYMLPVDFCSYGERREE